MVNGKGSLFIGNQVWIPNTSGGFTPVDPDLVVTTYGGKQIIDPRIIINDTGGIRYPADYDLPSHTGGNISNNLLDKKDSILTGGEIEIGHWGDNVIQKYHPKPELEEITGFPDLKPVRAKTPVQGGGKLRARWKDKDNKIFEWDSQHGELEMYDKRGRHLGAFDPKTGKQIKDPDPKRRIEP
ncbi:hypothetical protein GVX76_09220 [[Haemophilus] felis]|nr:hypothetical protein [[Haemophilus] felis]